MQRALMSLNLYGRQVVWCKLKKGVKPLKMHFYPLFELMLDSLTTKSTKSMLITSIYSTYQALKFWRKNVENWRSWKMTFCFVGFFKFFFLNENHLGFHMRYHLFLHYWWFLQNLEKGFILTNMHTTVYCKKVPRTIECLAAQYD